MYTRGRLGKDQTHPTFAVNVSPALSACQVTTSVGQPPSQHASEKNLIPSLYILPGDNQEPPRSCINFTIAINRRRLAIKKVEDVNTESCAVPGPTVVASGNESV